MTGSIQASLSPAIAPAMSSVRDTAMAPRRRRSPAGPGSWSRCSRSTGAGRSPTRTRRPRRAPGRTPAPDHRWRPGRSRSSSAACRSGRPGPARSRCRSRGGCPGARSGWPRQLGCRPGREAGVGRLRPGPPGVGRELDAGDADARRERAGAVVAGVARLHVDVVVGARGQDVRLHRVDRQPGLVLLVLREQQVVAADGHFGRAARGDRAAAAATGTSSRTKPTAATAFARRVVRMAFPQIGSVACAAPAPSHPTPTGTSVRSSLNL